MKRFVILFSLITQLLSYSITEVVAQVSPDTVNGWHYLRTIGNQSASGWSRLVRDTAYEGNYSQCFRDSLPPNTSIEWQKNYGREYRTPPYIEVRVRLRDGNWPPQFSADFRFFLVHGDTVFPIQGAGVYLDQTDLWYWYSFDTRQFGEPPSFFDQLVLRFYFNPSSVSGWSEILFDQLELIYFNDSTRIIDRFGDTGIPPAPALSAPPNGSINQPVTLTFEWQHRIDATRYHLQVATDSLFQNLVLNDSTISGTSRTVGPLQNRTWHYWRVRGGSSLGWGDFSDVWSFRTRPELPLQVLLVSPPDSANVGGNANLIWRAGVPEITRYWLEVAADSNFVFRMVDSTLTDTSRTVGGLVSNTLYYWKVRAGNVTGWGPFSAVRRFVATVTSVGDGNDFLVTSFKLHQNYPNPFNPSTVISFQLAVRSFVTLKVYNLLGEEVAILAEGEKSPGMHTVRFSARGGSAFGGDPSTGSGQALPSGIYFYRLTATSGGGETVTLSRKMVLLK